MAMTLAAATKATIVAAIKKEQQQAPALHRSCCLTASAASSPQDENRVIWEVSYSLDTTTTTDGSRDFSAFSGSSLSSGRLDFPDHGYLDGRSLLADCRRALHRCCHCCRRRGCWPGRGVDDEATSDEGEISERAAANHGCGALPLERTGTASVASALLPYPFGQKS